EVGQALGTNEDAAQKRVARAVEKLRGILAKRKVMIPLAGLTALLAAQSVPAAPAGLAPLVASAALKGSSLPSAVTLIKGTIKLTFWSETRTILIGAAAILLAMGTTTAVLHSALTKKPGPSSLQGAWEGTLDHEGRKLRMVLKVARKADAGYTATLD